MAFLATLPATAYIAAASTALSVGMQLQQGERQKSIAEMAARDKEKAGKEAAAAAQREAGIERKKAQYTMSRARAVAGASGAGVSDPTTTDLLTGIDAQGEANALNALYSGESYNQSAKRGAQINRNQGQAYESASYANAASTAISGGTSFWDKYGEDLTPKYSLGIP